MGSWIEVNFYYGLHHNGCAAKAAVAFVQDDAARRCDIRGMPF
jgi:hypothetical protein